MALLHLERLAILYSMLNFFGFLFSLLKGIYNTCAIHTQVNKQASVARILFAELFGIFSTSINNFFWTLNKLSITPNWYDTPTDNRYTTPTAPQSHNLHNNHPLSLVPRNYRKTAVTEHISRNHSYPQSAVTHIVTHQPHIEAKYEQIVEKPHITNFRSQNNHLFSPR